MIPYRFLSPAEEEMSEAALFMKRWRMVLEMISLMMYREQSTHCLIIPNLGSP